MKSLVRISPLICLASILAMLGGSSLMGQGREEQVITGKVVDPAAAIVPGAKILVTNLATGVTTEVETNADGIYRTPPLRPGDYRIDLSKEGFQTLRRSGITLHLAEILRVDLALNLGEITQTVEITAAAPVLNTSDGRLGEVVEQKAVSSLPLQDRGIGALITMAPGVYYEGQDPGSFNAPRFNMAGGANVVLSLDGAGAATPRTNVNQMVLSPPLESIQEVQIQQSYYGAEYGGAEGGMVRFTTKSGTNDVHGTVYVHARNELFDSRSSFAAEKKIDRYYLFGGNVGGPIKKNRAFYFVNLEGTKQSNPGSQLFTLPTQAMRTGDFSALNSPIYDPLTNRPDPANPGRFIRDAFPGNRIPQNRLDPVAVQIASYWPDANTPGVNNNPATWRNALDRHAVVAKVDYQVSSKDVISGSYKESSYTFGNRDLQPAFKDPAAIFESFAWVGNLPSHNFVFSETHTFSPTLVNNVRAAYRFDSAYTDQFGDHNGWGTKLGIKNFVADKDYGFPIVRFPEYMGLGNTSVLSRTPYPENSLEFYESLTYVRGKHSLKFGLDLQRSYNWAVCGTTNTGSYNFDTRLTALPGASGTGNSVASFLLGAVSTASVFSCVDSAFSEWYSAPYVADSFRVNSKLTLDLGLRWEFDLPVREAVADQGSGFDRLRINPVSGTPGVVTFQNQNGVPLGYYRTDKNRLQPRFGFAYQWDDKTVIRGGFGIYGVAPTLGSNRRAPSLGFDFVNASFTTTNDGLTPAFYLRDGIPSYTVGSSGARNDSFGAVPVGQSPTTNVNFVNYDWNLGYNENFNLSIQREFQGQTLVELAGIGALGRKLPISVNLNQVPRSLWGLTGNAQVRRPFPQFGNVNDIRAGEGITNFYAMTAKITKRLSRGFLLLGSYTWQKNVGVVSYQANDDHKLGRGPTIFEEANAPLGIPLHLARVSWVYDLPMGSGKSLFKSTKADWLLAGWTIGGILTYDSGSFFSLTSPSNSLNCFCNAGTRLDLVGDLHSGEKTLTQWFNTAAVRVPAFGQVGNLGTGILTAPDFRNLDLSVSKNNKFKERYGIKFTWEVFNVTNTTKYGPPGTLFGSPAFGVISGARGSRFSGAVTPPWFSARIMQFGLHFTW